MRWQLMNGRREQAEDMIDTMAKTNKKTLNKEERAELAKVLDKIESEGKRNVRPVC